MKQLMKYDHSLFYNAVIGITGRLPDNTCFLEKDGMYTMTYIPKDQQDEKKLTDAAFIIAKWMDGFDLLFSQSYAIYGYDPYSSFPPTQRKLFICVTHDSA